jgi:biopolymer transport protein TolR
VSFRTGGGDDLNSEINITPMVDVMLVLMIIFMITAPMMNTGVDLELPRVTAKAIDDPEGKLVLSIAKDNKLSLGTTPVSWTDLEAKLKTNERVKTESALYINADTNLPYGSVVTAMALAKNAGVVKVMLLTEASDNLDLNALDHGMLPGSQNKPK